MRWEQDLVGTALDIARLDHSPLRVVAGPGTGKTFALIRRLARLLEEGQTPDRVLACTFTRTAAKDLEKSVRSLGISGVDTVQAGTLHSLCFRILSSQDVLQATGRVPRPLLQFEEKFLLQDISGDLGGIRKCKKRLLAFNAAWARLQSEEPGWPTDPHDRRFQKELLRWLCFHESMLIGELIPETLQYLRENPATYYRRAYDHVLIDEYQDLNRAEQVLTDLLSGAGAMLVIGDEDQSIYSFKHAHPEGIASFGESHPNTLDKSLDVCRRCPPQIVAMANHLIKYNDTRQEGRTLQPLHEDGHSEIIVMQWNNPQEEAEGVAQLIKNRIDHGEVEPGKILVLSPRRQFGYATRDALVALDIPALSFFHEEALDGNPKKEESAAALRAFSLLTLLANPNDRVALRCWCGLGSSSLLKNSWHRIWQHCLVNDRSPWDALNSLSAGIFKLPYTAGLVDRFDSLVTRLGELKPLLGQELVDELFPPEAEWAQPLRSFTRGVGQDDQADKILDVLRTSITQPELPTDVDYVRVMSLHKSKGLTANMVVVLGCMEGLLPSIDTDLTPTEKLQSLEEQRRLFYVAITRTRKILFLSSVAALELALAHRLRIRIGSADYDRAFTIASRYLKELGPSRPETVFGPSLLNT